MGNQARLEEQWRTRVDTARIRLDFARSFVHEIEADMKSGAKLRTECEDEYRYALQVKLLAAEEFQWVLKAFTDLMVDGIVPPNDEKGHAKAQRAQGGSL